MNAFIEASEKSFRAVVCIPSHKPDQVRENVCIETHGELLKLRRVVYVTQMVQVDGIIDFDDALCERLEDIDIVRRGLRELSFFKSKFHLAEIGVP